MPGAARFYREVSVTRGEDNSYAILLDGKPIKTPAGAAFAVPNAALAEAIAAEWRDQGEKIRPETMPLTKLANTAIDRVAADRRAAIEQILAFARSDVVCYRAEGPQELVQRQSRLWDPLLAWARDRYGATLVCTTGIAFLSQPQDALAALERAVASADDFTLAGLHAAATLAGSVVIALALAERVLSPEQAYAAAELDAIYQAEKWGKDEEALRLSKKKANELSEIAIFLGSVFERDNAL